MIYLTILPTPCNAHVDLGGTVQVPAQETTAILLQLQDEHAESRLIHDNHNNMNASLNNMVL